MSADNKDAVAELKALAEKATPGPWDIRRETDDECCLIGYSIHADNGKAISDDDTAPNNADALFIAAANPAAILNLITAHAAQAERIEALSAALVIAEAALADIGDADREPGDDVAWCESRAAEALPAVRAAMDRPSRPVQQPRAVTARGLSARDAERYRFLRDSAVEGYPSSEGCSQKDTYLVITGYDDLYPMSSEQKDIAVDAAAGFTTPSPQGAENNNEGEK